MQGDVFRQSGDKIVPVESAVTSPFTLTNKQGDDVPQIFIPLRQTAIRAIFPFVGQNVTASPTV